MTRVVALDHGAARCGVAVGDPTGTIVRPLDPVRQPDTKPGLARLAEVCREVEAQLVVVGLPLSMDGSEGVQAEAARRFAQRLGARLDGVDVRMFDERLTTAEAQLRGGTASEDSRAAAVLLERWYAAEERA